MAKQANKNRKYQRNVNSAGAKAYKAQNRKRVNKIRKLTSYLRYNPNDKQAKKALKRVNADATWGLRK